LRSLVDASDRDGSAHVFVGRTDRIEPLCALWRPTARVILGAAFAAGERAVHRAMADLEVIEVPMARGALINVNTPDDLRIE
jgi:molybdopterin-guanine dinucleotide biosynthesis protein A